MRVVYQSIFDAIAEALHTAECEDRTINFIELGQLEWDELVREYTPTDDSIAEEAEFVHVYGVKIKRKPEQ